MDLVIDIACEHSLVTMHPILRSSLFHWCAVWTFILIGNQATYSKMILLSVMSHVNLFTGNYATHPTMILLSLMCHVNIFTGDYVTHPKMILLSLMCRVNIFTGNYATHSKIILLNFLCHWCLMQNVIGIRGTHVITHW